MRFFRNFCLEKRMDIARLYIKLTKNPLQSIVIAAKAGIQEMFRLIEISLMPGFPPFAEMASSITASHAISRSAWDDFAAPARVQVNSTTVCAACRTWHL
jgi:hypothetical protein